MKYPIKISWKTETAPLLMLAVAFIMGWYFYTHFPDRVAAHWNFAGMVDRYSGRTEGALILPVLLTLVYGLFLALPLIDPKKDRYAEFEHYFRVFRFAIMLILLVVYAATGLYNLGYPVKIGNVVPVSIGLLFVVLGNFMGKIKNNWFMGIRTPWTLSSENVWNKTHRLGGWLFVIYGLIIAGAPYLSANLGAGLLAGGTVLLVVGTTVYSYWLYRRERKI